MLAKIAATVDVVAGGRMVFGIGVGSRPGHPLARREYDGYGLPFHDTPHAVGSFAEACTVIRRLWSEDKPFDFHGDHIRLTGAFCNPKPVRRPLVGRAAAGRRARRHLEHPRLRRPGRPEEPQRAARSVLRRDRPRPGRDHPVDPGAGLLRPARRDPGRDRGGPGDRHRALRAQPAGALPRRGRPVGRRRADHDVAVTGRAGP
ncbi:LLM class flavin-dependent oxidoreductase [Paractinoplanes toevensis]|uniref:LLM class flavin-dependent oxidoreductase n=1 Tax=Paractinoplanes toevensis TaxID=571911 RepID=UPI001FE5EE94|nr:LLM class flavin-dependent oxidoreductase [Actinoplanes toevensis]